MNRIPTATYTTEFRTETVKLAQELDTSEMAMPGVSRPHSSTTKGIDGTRRAGGCTSYQADSAQAGVAWPAKAQVQGDDAIYLAGAIVCGQGSQSGLV
jgi:hypothetical protein